MGKEKNKKKKNQGAEYSIAEGASFIDTKDAELAVIQERISRNFESKDPTDLPKEKDKKKKDKKKKDKKKKDKKKKDKKKKKKDKKKKKSSRSDDEADKIAPSPGLTKFLREYGVDMRVGRPRERILSWAARVHETIVDDLSRGATAADLLTDMLRDDIRLVVFYLEGGLRLYRRAHEALEDPYRIVKDLEDRLGQLSAIRGFHTLANQAVAPEPARKYLEHEDQRTTRELLDVLDDRWLPGSDGRVPALTHLLNAILATDLGFYEEDRDFLRNRLVGELDELCELELDMGQLQGDVGVHELRRQLRWFPICATATDGLFRLTDEKNPLPRYIPMLNTDLADSKYSQLPSSEREPRPLQLSRSLFVANNNFISKLGAIKDRGEEIEAMEHALVGGGLYSSVDDAREEALALLKKGPADFRQVYRDAQTIYDELVEVGYFTALRVDVEQS